MPLKIVLISENEVIIYAKQGEKWELILQAKDANNNPLDITNYSIIAQAKKTYLDSIPVFSFHTEKLDETHGICKIYMLPNETSQIRAFPKSINNLSISEFKIGLPGVYVFDIKIYNTNDAIRILEGKIIVDPEVSKN